MIRIDVERIVINVISSFQCYAIHSSSHKLGTVEFHFIIETTDQSRIATFEKTLRGRGVVGDIPFHNTSLSVRSTPGSHRFLYQCKVFIIFLVFIYHCFHGIFN